MNVATAAANPRRLTSAPFAFYFTAQTLATAAEMFSYVALGWVTLQLTGSGTAVGAVLATQAIPRAVLMLLGGALSDRLTPLRVMTVSAAARALLLAAFTAALLTGRGATWELFVVAAGLGVIGAFFVPSRSSALPAVIDAELIQPANAAIMIATQAGVVVGPAIAGLVVARGGSATAFGIDAAGYAAAVALLLPLWAVPARGERSASTGLLADVVAGLRYMWDSVLTRTILAVIVVLNFAVNGPFEVGVVLLSKRTWGGALAFGAVMGAFGVGSLLGALVVGRLRLRFGWALIAVCAAFGLGFPLLGLFGTVWPAAVVTALIGSVNACVQVLGLSWLQTRTPPELLGRVMSVVMTGAMAVSPFSYAIGGVLAGVNVELALAAAGALCLLTGVAAALSRTVREAE